MGIWIQGGHMVDPSSGYDAPGDLYIQDGKIAYAGTPLPEGEREGRIREEDTCLDASGCLVVPGLVDMHVHFRDPGQTRKEDFCTGSRSAARGGVTSVVAMPNTTPPIDSAAIYRETADRAAAQGIRILQAGALTRGQEGRELSDIAGMAAAGALAFSEDGKSVPSAGLMREALKITAACHIPVLDHCEDMSIRGAGVMNDDDNARRLGLAGIANSTEDVIAARDITLAAELGAPLHLCHCSTAGAAAMMRSVRREGINGITAEVCPHHLLLTSDDIRTDDPNYKMNPPLRTRRDVDALLEALCDGDITVISTDHAPHTAEDKAGSIKNAAFGIVGLETSFALMYTYLVEKKVLTLSQLIACMSTNPARILGIPAGTLGIGACADVAVFNIADTYAIDKAAFASKGRNTPFDGWEVRGKAVYTLCGGRVVWDGRR